MERDAVIVAGFGCRAMATAASFASALDATGAEPDMLAVPAHRATAAAPFADALGKPLIAVDPAGLAGIDTATRSDASFRAHGTGSVAEATALVAAGPGARLLVVRHVSTDGMATCAIAEARER